ALPWPDQQLQQCLQVLDEQQVKLIDNSEELQQQLFRSFFPELYVLPLLTVPAAEQTFSPLPFWLENGIGGRKLQQIDAICQQWPGQMLPVVEWCAGKGHLGRILAHRFTAPVTSIEWQAALCRQGEDLAAKYKLAQQFICADVLNDSLQHVLQPQQQLVALHACGQLHISMLEQAVQAGCQQLLLVPCCYHLIPQPCYQPMSAIGIAQDLDLAKDDLKLIVQG